MTSSCPLQQTFVCIQLQAVDSKVCSYLVWHAASFWRQLTEELTSLKLA